MKFKIPFLLILIISLFTVAACNKKDGEVTPNVLRKLDKVTVSDGTFRHYTYDAQGRCARIDYKTYYVTFVYNGTTVVESLTWNNPNTSSPTYTYTLNAQGLAITRKYTSGSSEYLEEYEYNSRGQQVKIIAKSRSSSTSAFSINYIYSSTYDADGDWLTYKYESVASPSSNFVVTYEFDKSHYNTTFSEFARREGLGGKGAVHALTKLTQVYADGRKITANYAITYDVKGYMIGQTLTEITANGTTVLTYNYTYK